MPRSKPPPSKTLAAKPARLAKSAASAARLINGRFVPGHAAPGPGRPRSGAPSGALGADGYLSAEAIRRALVKEQRRRPTVFDQLTVDDRRELAELNGITPLQFLMSVMLDPLRYMDTRIDAAKAALPYFHRKMPVAIELPGGDAPAVDLGRVLALSRDDRLALLTLLNRVGIDLTAGAPAPLVERLASAEPGAEPGEPDGE